MEIIIQTVLFLRVEFLRVRILCLCCSICLLMIYLRFLICQNCSLRMIWRFTQWFILNNTLGPCSNNSINYQTDALPTGYCLTLRNVKSWLVVVNLLWSTLTIKSTTRYSRDATRTITWKLSSIQWSHWYCFGRQSLTLKNWTTVVSTQRNFIIDGTTASKCMDS